MTYDDLKKVVGRKRCQLVELQCDFCTNAYGTAPCTAAVGVTGAQKCFNTRISCQDPANYAPTQKSYVFSDQPVLLPPQGETIIVAGQGGEYAISFDGGTFTLPPSPPVSIHMISVSDVHVITGNMTISNDGSAWAVQLTPLGAAPIFALNFCNGFWFVGTYVGNTGAFDVAVSADGVSWTGIVIPMNVSGTGQLYNGFFYANGTYYAWTANNAEYATSPDASTWTPRTAPMAANFRVMGATGSVVVCAGELAPNFTRFFHSTDGVTWTVATITVPRVDFAIVSLKWNGSIFVAVGYRGSSTEGVIYTSTDGITWTYRTNSFNGASGLTDVAYGNGLWVAVGAAYYPMVSADNGLTWVQSTGVTIQPNGIVFYSGLFYAACLDSKVHSSADGVTWDGGVGSGHLGDPIYRIAVRP